jgi:hypothetical protein
MGGIDSAICKDAAKMGGTGIATRAILIVQRRGKGPSSNGVNGLSVSRD